MRYKYAPVVSRPFPAKAIALLLVIYRIATRYATPLLGVHRLQSTALLT